MRRSFHYTKGFRVALQLNQGSKMLQSNRIRLCPPGMRPEVYFSDLFIIRLVLADSRKDVPSHGGRYKLRLRRGKNTVGEAINGSAEGRSQTFRQ